METPPRPVPVSPRAAPGRSPADAERVRRVAVAAHQLAVLATARPDRSIQATVVSAGVMARPSVGEPAVACVAIGGTVKLANLRRDPHATVVFRAGGEWVTVEGRVTLLGPDDPQPGFPPDHVPQLLRDVFTAAGGSHEDWAEFDRVVAAERRTAVFIAMDRVYSNPSGG
jgi:PPOX class probable F420-dependent enzyme